MRNERARFRDCIVRAGQAAVKACTSKEALATNAEISDLSLSEVERKCIERACENAGTDDTGRSAHLYSQAKKACLEEISQISPQDAEEFVTYTIRWAFQGFPIIRIKDRLAASFAMTSAPKTMIDLPVPPWDSFMIDLPSDVFTAPNAGALLYVLCQARASTFMGPLDDIGFIVITDKMALKLRYIDDGDTLESDEIPAEEVTRIQRVIARVFAGICGELIDRRQAVEDCECKTHEWRRRKGKTPTAWEFILGRDVNLDCRQSVRDYLAGRAKRLMTVQSLVRGHYKWQPCGPRNSLRKWIHIEPFWRGPEDAPIVRRAHILEP